MSTEIKIQYPKRVTMLVDRREKRPIIFPKRVLICPSLDWRRDFYLSVATQEATLHTGDYGLKGYLDRCMFERKGSLEEVQQNLLTKDRERFLAALRRLIRETRAPYLILDFSVSQLLTQNVYVPEPNRVVDELLRVLGPTPLRIIFTGPNFGGGPRRKLGELLVRIAVNHCFFGSTESVSGSESETESETDQPNPNPDTDTNTDANTNTNTNTNTDTET